MITTLLIDDEVHNRNLLRSLLQTHCPEINVIGEAENADQGFDLLMDLKPQLILLDIRMGEKSGFDLLRRFETLPFEVIFVSGFNEYAIAAFDFNALAYILKPIDYTKLTAAVSKAVQKIRSKEQPSNDALYFIKNLNEKDNLISRISLHHHDKVVLVNVNEIAYIEALTYFCRIELADNSRYTSSKNLKLFEKMLEPSGLFLRINKSVLINMQHIKSYTKGEVCVIQLKSGLSFEVSRRKKAEIITFLKENNSGNQAFI
ncbi:MAG: LytR/AlgR family response regulator transcription factor [Bacteroidia bacterium]